jgi:beta-glucanase (GH16 family)
MRRKLLVLLGVVVVVFTTAGAGCVYDPAADGYEVVWEDEFDMLDTSVWNTTPYGGSLPATVTDGVMTVRATTANSSHWGHVTSLGQRRTTEPSYPDAMAWEEGYFEARIRYSASEWAWPAFWLFSMSKAEAWPYENCPPGGELTSEWDIFENRTWGGLPTTVHDYSTALHRNTSDGTTDGYCGVKDEQKAQGAQLPDVDLSAWHVWGARWTATELCTYLDGVQLLCTTPYDSTPQPMHLNFTMAYIATCPTCGPKPPELTMDVDWVRVWQK